MIEYGIVLDHVVLHKGIEVDKVKIDLVSSLPYLANVRGVCYFLEHASFNYKFIENFSKIGAPLFRLLQKEVAFEFNDDCKQ